MIVLGIESSCDETAAALLKDGCILLSNVIASQIPVHSKFGGVVPELASRKHLDNICSTVGECLMRADILWNKIDAISVTKGPGLMGALLVGTAYAKGLAYSLNLPCVGINHLEGHIYSVLLNHPKAKLPALSLVVSGGHTSLFHFQKIGDYKEICKTRDDAAGEALDKLSKHLGLGYPGGPIIEKLSPYGDPNAVLFTIPKISDGSLDFSFSGIKTAALRHLHLRSISPIEKKSFQTLDNIPQSILDLVSSYQNSIIDQLLDRLAKALVGREVHSIQISGGVSCNSELRRRATEFFQQKSLPVYYPQLELTTDNAAMIAAAGTTRLLAGNNDLWNLTVNSNLSLTN